MGKRVHIVTMAVLMLASASLAGAWQVEIENKSKTKKDVYVAGNHLFWNQIECSYSELKPGEKVTCQLPGAICPIYVKVKGLIAWCYPQGGQIPCCWNLKGVIEEDGTPFGNFKFK